MPSPTWKPIDDPWIGRWSLVAKLTANIEPDDRRLPAIRRILHECDAAYSARNAKRFVQAGKHLRRLIEHGVPRKAQEKATATRPVERVHEASQDIGTAANRRKDASTHP